MRRKKNPLCIQTANGPISAEHEVPAIVKALKVRICATVGGDTPDLLSMGYRCMKQGFGFHWMPFQTPYFVRPEGKGEARVVDPDPRCTQINLSVENYIPYLYDNGTLMTEAPGSVQALSATYLRQAPPTGETSGTDATSDSELDDIDVPVHTPVEHSDAPGFTKDQCQRMVVALGLAKQQAPKLWQMLHGKTQIATPSVSVDSDDNSVTDGDIDLF